MIGHNVNPTTYPGEFIQLEPPQNWANNVKLIISGIPPGDIFRQDKPAPTAYLHHFASRTQLIDHHNQSLADLNILCYYLHSAHLLHGWVGETSCKGELPMSKRLAGYDYSQPGYYMVTICTQYHRLIFGTIVDAQVALRAPGQMADSVWMSLSRRFAHVKLDEYVFMPNHMHGIIQLMDLDTTTAGARAPLWEIVRVFKAASSYYIRHAQDQPWFAWQDDYYDSVIRTEKGLEQACQYILENPLRWAQDKFYTSY